MLLLGSVTRSFAKRCVVLVLLAGLALGTEYYEHLRDTFPIEWPDVAADCEGSAAGVALLSLVDLGGFLLRKERPNER
jgi:hypothetical protein